MTTNTAGTLATTTLTAIQFIPGYPTTDSTHATDFATVANGVARDPGQPLGATLGNSMGPRDAGGNKIGAQLPGAVDASGWVTLPGGRGRVQALPGDWIANDGFGNVFVIPARALPKTLTLASCTTTNNSPALVFPSDIRTLGWQNGTHITGTNIPAGSVIGDLGPDGKSANIYAFATGLKANATGSSAAVTITAGTFTHS